MCGDPAWMSERATIVQPASAGGQPCTSTVYRRTTSRPGSMATAHTASTTKATGKDAKTTRRTARDLITWECSVHHEHRHAAAARADVDDGAARGARDAARLRALDVERVRVHVEPLEHQGAAFDHGELLRGDEGALLGDPGAADRRLEGALPRRRADFRADQHRSTAITVGGFEHQPFALGHETREEVHLAPVPQRAALLHLARPGHEPTGEGALVRREQLAVQLVGEQGEQRLVLGELAAE